MRPIGDVLRYNMKLVKQILIPLLIFSLFPGCGDSSAYQPQNGDIIFHISRSSQSLAIQRATKSRYSHMGIVYLKSGSPFVFEAVEPVKLTPLQEWIKRGNSGHYVVKRLSQANQTLTEAALKQMLEVGKTFEGKHYDLYFEWSDDQIYCSELVWKVYKRALGLEIAALQTMREFDLSDPIVQAKIQERFGQSVPMDEKVITPAAIFASELFVTVFDD